MNERERLLLNVLLQDVGTVFQRTGQDGNCPLELPHSFQEAVSFNARPDACANVRLAPIAENIFLQHASKNKQGYQYRYPLKPLSVEYDEFMPATGLTGNVQHDYIQLWNAFAAEFNGLQHQQDFDAYFFTIYFLLKKYFSRVPSLEAEDISLFDQARVRAAMKDCQYRFQQESGESPADAQEFLLIEGDVSGIQNFIFRMVAPQQEQARLTKRLRGRSFYLLLLTETLADYLLKTLDLTIIHQLWCGGGHFLLIAPNTEETRQKLTECYRTLNQFLLTKFRGELGCVLSWISASEQELLRDYHLVQQRISRSTEDEKRRKMHNVLADRQYLQFSSKPPARKAEYGPSGDRFVEELNQEQEEIGAVLARLGKGFNWLVNTYQSVAKTDERNVLTAFKICSQYQITWIINPERVEQADSVYLLNETKNFWGTGKLKYGFKFVAVHVDRYETQSEVDVRNGSKDPDEPPVFLNDIKNFSDLAAAGAGGFMGVLRMDVDHLGAIFSLGIAPQQRSLTRVAGLSSAMDLFFTGYLQHLCQHGPFQKDAETPKFRKQCYIAYSGGDDLFIIGAWDVMVALAWQVRQDFTAFTCDNKDLNISGGVFLCKGKYPVSQAAERAKYLLDDLAKENAQQEYDVEPRRKNGQSRFLPRLPQRNAIAVFNHRLSWQNFEELKSVGDTLIRAIRGKRLNRVHLYKILDLYNTWSRYRSLNTARMYYISVRTIKDREIRELMLQKLARHEYLSNQSYIPILIGYAGLKTRDRQTTR